MPFSSTLNGDGTGDGKGGQRPARVELVLYVSSTPRCIRTITTIKGVLARFPENHISLTIHDLSTDPHEGVEDSISYTPTLVRRAPRPRMFILGDITNAEIVVELLQGAGEEAV